MEEALGRGLREQGVLGRGPGDLASPGSHPRAGSYPSVALGGSAGPSANLGTAGAPCPRPGPSPSAASGFASSARPGACPVPGAAAGPCLCAGASPGTSPSPSADPDPSPIPVAVPIPSRCVSAGPVPDPRLGGGGCPGGGAVAGAEPVPGQRSGPKGGRSGAVGPGAVPPGPYLRRRRAAAGPCPWLSAVPPARSAPPFAAGTPRAARARRDPGQGRPLPRGARSGARRPPWISGTRARRSAARAARSCCGGWWCWGCAPWSRWCSTTGRWVEEGRKGARPGGAPGGACPRSGVTGSEPAGLLLRRARSRRCQCPSGGSSCSGEFSCETASPGMGSAPSGRGGAARGVCRSKWGDLPFRERACFAAGQGCSHCGGCRS